MAHRRESTAQTVMRPDVESPSRIDAARRVAFLDRDGIINERAAPHEYVLHREQFRLRPGAVGLMRKLHDLGYALVVVTNQQGVGKGLMTESELRDLHAWMCAQLAAADVRLAAIHACTHLASDECACRKPKPGLIDRAVAELPYGVDLARSVIIGDSATDMQAGRAAGVGILLLVGCNAAPLAFGDVVQVAALGDALAFVRGLHEEQDGGRRRLGA